MRGSDSHVACGAWEAGGAWAAAEETDAMATAATAAAVRQARHQWRHQPACR
jgi:hypothetical protein